jgi:hypothetical protein
MMHTRYLLVAAILWSKSLFLPPRILHSLHLLAVRAKAKYRSAARSRLSTTRAPRSQSDDRARDETIWVL